MSLESPRESPEGSQPPECALWKAGGKSFVLGVRWTYAEDVAAARQIKAALKKSGDYPKGTQFQALPNADDTWLVAAWSGKGQYLAAPLMAQVIRSGVFVQPLSDGRVWMLGVSGNCVLPGHDQVVEADRVHEVLRQWYATLPDATLYGDESGSQRSAEDCWADLLSQIKNKDIDPKILKAAALGAGGGVALLAGFAVLALLAGGVVMLPPLLRPDAPAVVDLGALDMARRAQEEAARRERLLQRFEQEVQRLRQAHSQPSGMQEVFAAMDLLQGMRFESEGMTLNRLICERAARASEDQSLAGKTMWRCVPLWMPPAKAGLLAQARVRAQPLGLMDELPADGLEGIAFELAVSPEAPSFAVRPDGQWWLHQFHDLWLAAGLQVVRGERDERAGPAVAVVTIRAIEPLVVSAHGIQEDGYALDGVSDRVLGESARIGLDASWSQMAERSWREFWRTQPVHVERFVVDADGRVRVDMRLSRLEGGGA